MAVRDILQLGNPVLREKCRTVRSFDTGDLESLINDLQDTLYDFRSRSGFGRGIAAPQIGSTSRVVFLDVGEPMGLVNPVITTRSRKLMTLWDDCFSFPDLLVKVKRSLAVTVTYRNLDGRRHILNAEGSLAELLQHEIDHLDGVLAIDRAIDSKHIVYREEYGKWQRRKGLLL